jgi:hypothetical protein
MGGTVLASSFVMTSAQEKNSVEPSMRVIARSGTCESGTCGGVPPGFSTEHRRRLLARIVHGSPPVGRLTQQTNWIFPSYSSLQEERSLELPMRSRQAFRLIAQRARRKFRGLPPSCAVPWPSSRNRSRAAAELSPSFR